MFRIRSDNESFRLNGQQIIVPHHPCHLLAVHLHASAVQFCSDPSIAVTTTMFQSDLLNQGPHFRLFLCRFLLSQRPIYSALPTDTCARCSACLAMASVLGCVRRCLPARAAAALASSLYFLQGTLQKIHLHRLLGEQPL